MSEREAFQKKVSELTAFLDKLRPGTGPAIAMFLEDAYEQGWQAARAAAPPNDAPSRDTCPKCKSGDPKIMLVAHSFRYGRWREIDELSCDPGRIDCNSWHNAPPVADSGASAGEEK